MAMPTDTQIKALLVRQVGEVATTEYPAGLLAGNVDLLWDLYAGDAVVSPTLRQLKVQRDLVDLKLGTFDTEVDFVDGDHSQRLSQAAAALQKRRDALEDRIATETDQAQGASGAAIGTLVTVTPETPPAAPLYRPYGPDATDPQYQGSPYYRDRRRAW